MSDVPSLDGLHIGAQGSPVGSEEERPASESSHSEVNSEQEEEEEFRFVFCFCFC